MVPGRSVSCVRATGYWSVLLSASGVRADPECTPSATTWMYSPNEPTRPSRRCTTGVGGGAGGGALRLQNPPSLTGGGGAAASGGARGGSGLAMLNHAGQGGPRPPPPREHFEQPKRSPLLK